MSAELYAEVAYRRRPRARLGAGGARPGEIYSPTIRNPRSRRRSVPPIEGPFTFAYDPAARTTGTLESLPVEAVEIGTSDGATARFLRFAAARFELRGQPATLEVFWLDAYGGGIYLSFRDATSGEATYGGGRYLLDTVKGADLGTDR